MTFKPISTEINPGGTAETVSISLAGDGSNGVSVAALHTLRDQVLPSTLGQVNGVDAADQRDTIDPDVATPLTIEDWLSGTDPSLALLATHGP